MHHKRRLSYSYQIKTAMYLNGVPVDGNESYLVADPHTEADLGEGCVPVGWQLGLL